MATKSNTMAFTDIIGSPSNYPQSWKDAMASGRGTFGVPLIVAEDGTSYLPNASMTTWKLSRKANATPLQVLKSTDSGATWTALAVTTNYTFNTITNAITFLSAPASTDLIMVTYQTHTNMAVVGVNSEVLAIGDVWAGNYSEAGKGAHLLSTMLNKISNFYGNSFCKLVNYELFGNFLWAAPARYPTHGAVNTSQFGSTSPTVKTFQYLTRSSGKARLQLVFKEMKYSAANADWGDDSTFNIVDNVSTTTDWYGNTVLIGQKYAELPYFIEAKE